MRLAITRIEVTIITTQGMINCVLRAIHYIVEFKNSMWIQWTRLKKVLKKKNHVTLSFFLNH